VLAAALLWLALHALPAPAALASALLVTELATWWRCARRVGAGEGR